MTYTIGPASLGKSALLNDMFREQGIGAGASSTVGGFRVLEPAPGAPTFPAGRIEEKVSKDGSIYFIWKPINKNQT